MSPHEILLAFRVATYGEATIGSRRRSTTILRLSMKNSRALPKSYSIARAPTDEVPDVLDGACIFCYSVRVFGYSIFRYQDYLNMHDDHKSSAFVLNGGIKNWLSTFEGQDSLIDHD